MRTQECLALGATLAGAGFALIAAWYWLRSTRTTLPTYDPATRRPTGTVDMLTLYLTVIDASRDNKIAAISTGISVLLMAAGSLLSVWK
ncbi:MAG: hypothetical protein WCL27_02315 [Betaproteobacteria bacterium]